MAPLPPVRERDPLPGEALLTATAAAKRLGKTRQAIDAAVRKAQIPGFKSTQDGHIYVDRSHIEELEAREDGQLRALEKRVQDLEANLERQADDETSKNDARLAAARDANLLLVAAMEEREAALKARMTADKRLRQHTQARKKADKHADAAAKLLREALQQLSTPASPHDI